MEDWIKDVRYILMPASHPLKGFEKEYFQAYATWRAAWEKFYGEIGIKEPLNADAFVLPDEIGAVFYKDECVGICEYTYGTLNSWDTMKDFSWFRSWTPEALEKLANISRECMIGSQFSISPKFTGKNQIVRWKDIMFLFLFLRLENSISPVMAGHLNVSRGMDKAGGGDNGATVLNAHHKFLFHGAHQESQLVAYEKKVVSQMIDQKGWRPLCDSLWSRLVHLSDYTSEAPLQFAKKAA